MNDPQAVSMDDLLFIIGRQTVQIEFLQKRVAHLEQTLAGQAPAANGVAEVPEKAPLG